MALIGAGILLGAAAVTIGTSIFERSENRKTTRLSIQIPPAQKLVDSFFAVTPDGRTIAYSAVEKNPVDGDWIRKLYLRSLDSYETTTIEGSEGVAGSPAFSPDGKQIAWVAPLPTNPAQHLIAVHVNLEAPPRVIGKWPQEKATDPSMAWLTDGHIVAVTNSPARGYEYAVTRFPSDGRPPAAAIPLHGLDVADFGGLGGSSVLPDGKTLLTAVYLVEGNTSTMSAVTIDTQVRRDTHRRRGRAAASVVRDRPRSLLETERPDGRPVRPGTHRRNGWAIDNYRGHRRLRTVGLRHAGLPKRQGRA